MKSKSIVFVILVIGGLGAMAASLLYGKPINSQTLNANEQPRHHQLAHNPGSCEVSVDGHTTQVELNQGMTVKGRWVSCQRYEGHPVLIYGNDDKQLTNLGQ